MCYSYVLAMRTSCVCQLMALGKGVDAVFASSAEKADGLAEQQLNYSSLPI